MLVLTSWALLAAFFGMLAFTIKLLDTYLADIMRARRAPLTLGCAKCGAHPIPKAAIIYACT